MLINEYLLLFFVLDCQLLDMVFSHNEKDGSFFLITIQNMGCTLRQHFNVLSWKSICGWYQTTYCNITWFSIGQGSATPNIVNDLFCLFLL